VSNLIGFKFQLKSNSLQSMCRIFQQVFPDDMLVNEYMLRLPITPNLNARLTQIHYENNSKTNSADKTQSTSNSLGIYFLNQWIKSNSFLNKRQFDLNTWLFEQIKQCAAPLHPIIISLINTYITQLFNLNILSEHRLIPLPAQLILDFFRDK
jgi:hypothetical protein